MITRALLGLIALVALLSVVTSPSPALAESWVINSYDVEYVITRNGDVQVTEDIRLDFGTLEKHGIFREMPVRYRYDDDNDRLISVTGVTVDDGNDPYQFELISNGANLQIKIGDSDVIISGPRRYRIQYTLLNALNADPFLEDGTRADWDEFYWNVTGNNWEVTILKASAEVRAPGPFVEGKVSCYEGPTGSTDPCKQTLGESEAQFESTSWLNPGSGLTIATPIEKGVVDVGPPVLVEPKETEWERFTSFWDFTPAILIAAAAVVALFFIAFMRVWWVQGRDNWYGDLYQIHDGNDGAPGVRKPMFSREAVVVEFAPPDIARNGRRLRPAEIGLLLDERADTLDVTATIIDLAVRKHLTITEEKKGGIFGLFKSTDYTLTKLPDPEGDELLPYESTLKNGLFSGSQSVTMSSLKNKFYKDLERVKTSLYKQGVNDKVFPRDPDSTRTIYRIAGLVIAVAGGGVGYLLGMWFGGALIGIPVVIGGLLVALFAHLMPRRTARGRVLYRRSLGFRKFMTSAETERQRFAERSNIFHEYLPYAMVYGCVDRWAKAFEDLGIVPDSPYYYSGLRPFNAAYFAGSMAGFSSSISSTMASTPGSSGGSGGGGGGSSGGGGGGGGGGSW